MTAALVQQGSLGALIEALASRGPIAVAVSGGVDSLTLMAFSHDAVSASPRTHGVHAFHAVSAAVPPAATARVEALARARGWALTLIDAGETSDEAYLANPVDRCRVCKTHLYDAMGSATASLEGVTLVSGTNTDDLGDYRPGLEAARLRGVRHPFVEAGLDKAAVRSLARAVGLHDIAELPAQPCLSSRIETGTRIAPALLSLVDTVEERVRALLGPRGAVRCRVRARDIVIELDRAVLSSLDDVMKARVIDEVTLLAARAGPERPVSIAPYRMGSAFLHVL